MKGKPTLVIVCVILLGVLTFFVLSLSRPISSAIEGNSVLPPLQKPIDLSSLTWIEATSSAPWTTRDAHASIVFNNKIWLMGGLNGNPVTKNKYVEYWNAPYFNDIWTTTNGVDWTLEAATSTWHPRRSLSLEEFRGKIWLIGGWSPIDQYRTNIFTSTDGVNWTVTTTSPRWSDREGQVVKAFDNKLWVFGGVNYTEHKTFNDVWSSEDGIHWTEVASSSPWNGRWDHDVVVYKNKMWLLGGMHLDGSGEKDVWSTEDGKNWTLVTNDAPWGPLQGHEVVEYKGKMWIIGGWLLTAADIGSQTTWWSDDGETWHKTMVDNPWVGREDHTVVVFNDKIWVMGGMNTGFKWSNDVWYSTLGK